MIGIVNRGTNKMNPFDEHVKQRMDKGAVEYGDKSWARPKAEIIMEMLEEAADFGGWDTIAEDGEDLSEEDKVFLRLAVSYVRSAYTLANYVYQRLKR